jgi:hypothetical protein
LTTASGNIGIGVNFGTNMTDSQNVITIGDDGDGTVPNATDRTYIGSIRGVTVGNTAGVNVIIDSDGQLGTINSSCQFKKKTEGTPQFGLIAEDMAEVSPALVMRDKAGQVSYVRYDAVNVMLLNEFLKENQKVEAEQATIAELESTVA